MAEDDIYKSKNKYELFTKNYRTLMSKESHFKGKYFRKYFCTNPENIEYFPKLFRIFARKDISYIRRLRLLQTFKFICWACPKDLKDCEREDVDDIVIKSHEAYKSPKTKGDFIIDLKHLWKNLFPEKDPQGRIDETIMPYVVRHLSSKIDKSKEKRREDKFTIEEFEKLVKSFSQDKRLQAYLTLAFESLGRPQEILYTKIKDVEIQDNYAKIWISEHGKEGTGFLQSIDSFPYVVAWFNEHPRRDDPESFFFCNLGNTGRYKQLTPINVNKHIRTHLELLKIKKKVTCYSLKRNGVTYRRLRGDSDATIQHTARWTSTRQLKTYDYSRQDDIFKEELAKRGLIKDGKVFATKKMTKKCFYCDHANGIANDTCQLCKRPLDREKIRQQEKEKENEIAALKQQLSGIPDFINKLVEQKAEELLAARQK